MKLISTNPADNYAVLGEVETSSDEEIRRKVASAQAAKSEWKELGVENRIGKLKPIYDELRSRTDEIADLICRETGKTIRESRAEAERYLDVYLGWFMENAPAALADEVTLKDDDSLHRIVYEPSGVAACIAPWNYPFGMAIWGIFPNLIAGNTVVFKTSEECVLMGKLVEGIISGHDLPEGVFSMVHGAGDVGKKLVESDIDLIWFTGSTRAGKTVYKAAADRLVRVILELGGSNPCVVFADTDVVQTASTVYAGRFQHMGQVCSSLKRLIVQEDIADDLLDELGRIMFSKNIGDPRDEDTDHGSLVAERQLKVLEGQLQDALDKGAKIAAQARIPEGLSGAFFPPTILTGVTKDMRVWREEVFGPVLAVVTFNDEAEAVRLANDTIYGLGARVISDDEERAERVASRIEAGSIAINYEARSVPADPFGGFKSSGIGRERGVAGLRELCEIKVIQKKRPASGE